MMKSPLVLFLATLFVLTSAALADEAYRKVENEVADVERAFAQTMTQRDHKAFASFLSEEAEFLSGNAHTRGRQAVSEKWLAYFEDDDAPFSWRLETVAVLGSRDLAISTGPVFNSAGERTATYTSIWRQ